MHKNYYISETDKFAPEFYPDVIRELEGINESMSHIEGSDKSEIIISFLNDHCIPVGLVESNAILVKLITSRSLKTSHIESLFDSCRKNESFRDGLKACIKKELR